MSKGEALRDFMKQRLTAAAEEIFAQFESTIAEFEEELRRCKEENQRKQALLESVLSPTVALLRTDVKTSPGPGLNQDPNQEIPETSEIKDEPEEETVTYLKECVPESSAVCVKTEESSLPQQTEPEQEEPQEEDVSTEPHLHSEHTSDQDEDWTAPFSCSNDDDHLNQVQISAQNSDVSSKYSSAAETSATVNNGDKSGIAEGAEGKTLQCPVCKKMLKGSKYNLDIHMRIHTGERPFICSTCGKTFCDSSGLNKHRRTHTGRRPYSCPTCNKTFYDTSALNKHIRIHTGERPYSCSTCNKTFIQKKHLDIHRITHTGERPYICSICKKDFTQRSGLIYHMRTHRGEKPFSCSVCNKAFTAKCSLISHYRLHTDEMSPALNQEIP